MRETDLAGDTSGLGVLAPDHAVKIRAVRVSTSRTLALVLAVVLLNSFGNVLLAWGMRHLSSAVSVNPLGYIRAMLNPFVASGIVLLIVWVLTRMALLSWADLSYVLPLTGLGYVLTAFLGKCILGETVTATRWAGTFLIFAGTAMVGTTGHYTNANCEVSG